jgi:HNH endonuclease
MCNSPAHNSRPNRESLRKRLGAVIAAAIAHRDGGRCAYCSVPCGAGSHLDHLAPRAKGGADDVANLVTACASCNSARQDKPLATWCRAVGADARAIRRQAARPLDLVAARAALAAARAARRAA